MGTKMLVTGSILLAILIKFLYHLGDTLDVFKSDIIAQHSPGPCIELAGADGGSEDLTILPNGKVFISSGIYPRDRGKLLLFDFLDPTHEVTELKIEGDMNQTNAHYHGLSVWQNKATGVWTLAVINHPWPLTDSVEFFTFEEKRQVLIHKKTVRDPLFKFLNDLVLVSENEFYVTLSNKYSLQEIYFLLKLGKVLFYNGSSASVVAQSMFVPNGINSSPDFRFIYVNEFCGKQITVFERTKDNQLDPIQTKYLDTGVDNIEVDQKTGDIWIGAHPRSNQVLDFNSKQGEGISPSQVLKIKSVDGELKDVTEIYMNDGREISASSTASIYNRRMIIGSVRSKLLLCDVMYLP